MGESVRVIIRTRPLNLKEINQGSQNIVQIKNSNTMIVNNKSFNFDACLETNATQLDVYNIAGKPVVENVLAGYNGTIFAYGQTSTGKTHTMVGKSNDEQGKGLIPRMVEAIFHYIMNTASNSTFLVKVSYLEIYMEKVRDLLDIHKDNLPLFEDAKKTTYVKGATERYVSTAEEVLDILEEGKSNRKVAVTAMNLDSSRSHCIFSLSLRNEDQKKAKTLNSRLFLVDLAGSEKVSKSAVEGQTLDEAKGINKSLSALGNVINALTEGNGHIPYRDSKLTRILQDSLGGNSKTTMIICCSPAAYNESETKSSILFGMRAKTIKNLVSLNVELNAAEWQKLYQDLKKRYSELVDYYKELEEEVKKWRQGESVPKSTWSSLMNSGEISLKDNQNLSQFAKDTISEGRRSNISKSSTDAYQMLDKKDEEIAQISTDLNTLRGNYDDVVEKLNSISIERDKHKELSNDLALKLKMKDKELKDVLQSLEEMALSLDKADKLAIENREEHLKAAEENTKLMIDLKSAEAALADKKAADSKLRSILLEGIMNMKKDLGDIGSSMAENMDRPVESKSLKLETEFNNLIVYVTKIKGLTNNFVKLGRNGLVGQDAEPYKKVEILQKRLELSSQTYEERLANIILEKRTLESELLNMKSEQSRIMADLNTGPKQPEKVHQHLKSISDRYTEELYHAQEELENKKNEIYALRQKLDIAGSELSILRQVNTEIQIPQEKKDGIRASMRGMEDTLTKELGELQNLRMLFLNDLKLRVKKVMQRSTLRDIMFDDEDEFTTGEKLSPQQRERINFLENNLDSLTKVHKQLVRDNAELRCELPKLQKRVKAGSDRIKQLEQALKDSKETALLERKKYQIDLERLKDAFRSKDNTIKTAIVKPIRAGGVE